MDYDARSGRSSWTVPLLTLIFFLFFLQSYQVRCLRFSLLRLHCISSVAWVHVCVRACACVRVCVAVL